LEIEKSAIKLKENLLKIVYISGGIAVLFLLLYDKCEEFGK